MINRSVGIILLLGILLNNNLIQSSAVKTELSPIYGVNPELYSLYQGKVFSCLRSNKEIPIEQVNDNYCDCPDGTDEPGTPACNNGQFYCANKSYKPLTIQTSLINDGFCDCCDGTDEYNGKISCANTCKELGKELREKREKEIEQFTSGLSKKAELEKEAASINQEKSEELVRLKKEIEPLNSEIKELQTKKDDKEKEKNAEVEVLQKEREQQEKTEQEEKKEQPEQQANENAEGGEAKIEDSKAQPEEEAKPLSSPALEALKQGNDINSNNIKDNENDSDDDDDDDEDTYDNNIFTYMLSIIYDIYPTLWDLVREYLPHSSPILNDLEVLEKELSDKRESLREKEDAISNIEKLLNNDFGEKNVFLPLHGKCFDVKTKEYTYTFCPFDKASQGHTSLGKFEKWEDGHSSMLFTNGQQCWGGPKRSLKVSFECGSENEAYNVEEPSKCEYSMKFKTPGACDEHHLKILTLDRDHEL